MSVRIFYSWQSDLPSKVNRNFIEDALRKAIKNLGRDIKIQETLRDNSLVLDKDTKNIPGTPPITDTIFKKIELCDIFVPDITFVAKGASGRMSPNSNVLIEYGWALKCLSHGRMVPVMNTAFGEPSDANLPFNLRHLRHPLKYCLGETSEKRAREKVKTKAQLVKDLEGAISLIISSGLKKEEAGYAGIPATTDPSTFLQAGETFPETRRFGDTKKKLYLHEGPRLFLRIIPSTPLDPRPTTRALQDLALGLWPLSRGSDYYSGVNKYGTYNYSDDSGCIRYLTQLFDTGEIWGINAFSLKRGRFPWADVQSLFSQTLGNYLDFLRKTLRLSPPVAMKAGAANVEGFRVGSQNGIGGFVVKDHIEYEAVIDDFESESASRILEPFFAHFLDECHLS